MVAPAVLQELLAVVGADHHQRVAPGLQPLLQEGADHAVQPTDLLRVGEAQALDLQRRHGRARVHIHIPHHPLLELFAADNTASNDIAMTADILGR